MNKVLFSSERMDWETPNSLFNELNKEFNFTLDAASSDKNAKVKKHYTERENGLIQNWGGAKPFGAIRLMAKNFLSGLRSVQRKGKRRIQPL